MFSVKGYRLRIRVYELGITHFSKGVISQCEECLSIIRYNKKYSLVVSAELKNQDFRTLET